MPEASKSKTVTVKLLPQANDDNASGLENGLLWIDVLANDLAQNAASLWSLDQVDRALHTSPLTAVQLLSGASVWFQDGKVVYDASAAWDHLAAGELATDTFTYSIRLANGAVTYATVTVEIMGEADGITGFVSDGYVADATVFVDVDGDGMLDDDEDSTTTDANGDFFLDTAQVGQLLAFGGTNIDTGLANTLTLAAPVGASAINPLTTLIAAMIDPANGIDAGAAEAAIKSALGLPDVDLLSYDMLAAEAGDPDALAAQKAAGSVVTLLLAARELGGADAPAAEAAVLDALAGALTAGDPVALADTAVLSSIFAAALPDADYAAAVSSVAAANALIEDAGSFAEVAHGQALAAAIRDTDGDEWIEGSAADEVFDGRSSGYLAINGGDGSDTVVLGGPRDAFTFESRNGFIYAVGPDGETELDAIERVLFTDGAATIQELGPFTVEGTGNTFLHGTYADDILIGHATENDAVELRGTGTDFADGRGGDYDRVVIDLGLESAGATIAFTGTQVLELTSGTKTIANFEQVQFRDSVFDDTLSGGDGQDIFQYRGGNDVYDGGEGIDWIHLDAAFEDLVFAQVDPTTYTATAADGDVLTFRNFEGLLSYATLESVTNIAALLRLPITGTPGDDWLEGTDGDDVFAASGGNDYVIGSSGTDTLRLSGTRADYAVAAADTGGTEIMVVDLRTGAPDGKVYALSVEAFAFADQTLGLADLGPFTVTGTVDGDALQGTYGDDYIFGLDGDDLIYWWPGGNDVIDGGDGTDLVHIELWQSGGPVSFTFNGDGTYAMPTGETLTLTAVEDVELIGGEQGDTLVGGAGNDFIVGEEGDDWLEGGDGSDSLEGYEGDDTLIGGAGDDFIGDTAGNGVADGGEGTDVFAVLGERDQFRADYVDDTTIRLTDLSGAGTFLVQNVEIVRFWGIDATPEELVARIGEPGSDWLIGSEGNDLFLTSGGTDFLWGELGTDLLRLTGTRADYSLTADPDGSDLLVLTDLREADPETGLGPDGVMHLSSIERLQFADGNALVSEYGPFTFVDVPGNDGSFQGTYSNDVVLAGDGDDWLFSAEGTDTLDGGEGTDTAYFDFRREASGIIVDFSAASPIVRLGQAVTLAGIEKFEVDGSDFDDTITLGAGDDMAWASGGHDVIDGGDGHDIVMLDDGYNAFQFTLEGDGSLRITSTGLGGRSSDWSLVLRNVEGVVLSGPRSVFDIAALVSPVYGSSGGADLSVGPDDKVIIAGSGDDRIDTWGGGDAWIDGGDGDDLAYIDFAESAEGVFFQFDGSGQDQFIDQLGVTLVNVERAEIYGSDFDDRLRGGQNDDVVWGGAGNDRLFGAEGRDIVQGGTGNDILTGHAGNDIFQFDFTDSGDDVIADFIHGQDRIYLNGVTIGEWAPIDGDGDGAVDSLGTTYSTETAALGTITVGGLDAPQVVTMHIGHGGDDILMGTDGNDYLWGNSGSDRIVASTLGDDYIDGGPGFDWLIFNLENATEGLVFNLATDQSAVIRGGVKQIHNMEAVMTSGSQFADVITGGDNFDSLFGGRGDDVLNGGGGDDQLSGDFGNDTLTGGAGRDTFTINFYETGDKTITDFESGVDILQIDRSNILSPWTFADVDGDGSLDASTHYQGTVSGLGSGEIILLGASAEPEIFWVG
ncbi:MAG TPA: calcium-binding protein [Croceibacterium sp.]|nr:calcium-binding protein [Croceibacterium sp.]